MADDLGFNDFQQTGMGEGRATSKGREAELRPWCERMEDKKPRGKFERWEGKEWNRGNRAVGRCGAWVCVLGGVCIAVRGVRRTERKGKRRQERYPSVATKGTGQLNRSGEEWEWSAVTSANLYVGGRKRKKEKKRKENKGKKNRSTSYTQAHNAVHMNGPSLPAFGKLRG